MASRATTPFRPFRLSFGRSICSDWRISATASFTSMRSILFENFFVDFPSTSIRSIKYLKRVLALSKSPFSTECSIISRTVSMTSCVMSLARSFSTVSFCITAFVVVSMDGMVFGLKTGSVCTVEIGGGTSRPTDWHEQKIMHPRAKIAYLIITNVLSNEKITTK